MSVKEAVAVLVNAKSIHLAWGGYAIPLDPLDDFTLNTYGDYKVAAIQNRFELDTYEIQLATEFIKEVDK